jgi:CrcB protein
MVALAVSLAAGLGAVARYLVDLLVQHRTRAAFPYGTLLVNVTGSLLLGLTTGLAAHHGLPRTPTLVVGAGFAGGYTTLSTWAWETLALAGSGELPRAGANVVLSTGAGLLAAAGGLWLALL